MPTFEELSLPETLLDKLRQQQITEPTEIQQAAIPAILAGQDVIVHSQTGTGKTLAYLLPLLAKLDPAAQGLQLVIVVPTRELGMQIFREIELLTQGSPLFAQQLIGGANIRHQIDRLKKKPPIVVGTPGRIAELITARKLNTHTVKALVVDEIDQVMAPAFKNELIRVLKAISRDRQTIFASATIPASVEEVSQRWMKEPLHLEVEASLKLPTTLTHAFLVAERDKVDALRRLMHAQTPKAAIAFVNEGRRVDELVSKLTFKGLAVSALHGQARKQERATLMKAFREGQFQLLLATELAARGLDFKGLTHVYNLDLPTDAEHYVHRAGRTGRAGQPGTVVSIIAPNERFVIEKFAKALGVEFQEIELAFGKAEPLSPDEPKASKPKSPQPKASKPKASKPKRQTPKARS
ncbi:MAG TPA: DEAD/DEAH box helicase [Stenomitos sp.]